LQLRDRDLVSIQEARELAAQAAAAQQKFSKFSQEQVDAVVEAISKAAAAAAESLARAAVEETGFGNVPDKIIKNRLGAVDVANAIRGMRTVGVIREDAEKQILEIAVPVGVVCAIIPSTNPTSTAIYKILISLKARNAVVLSPHPSAIRCICQAARLLAKAASTAGAPDGLILCMERTTLAGTQELMRAPQVGLILATGGTGLVRAAYSSGKPAYGVGPGNVPAFIEKTADIPKAVADIFAGKTFDYGTICSSEQAIVAEESVRELALAECKSQSGYFLNPEEMRKLEALVFPDGSHAPSPKIVGRPAAHIAELAGFKVPQETRVLIARLEEVGRQAPLSAEKLSPILAFYSVPNLASGIDVCSHLLRFGGLGHTCSIHSQDKNAAREFGLAVPAFRVCVNTSAVHGAIGYSTNLFPAMTLGCGAVGGNITSDNIGPQHLFNVRRVAWESRAVEHRTIPPNRRMEGSSPADSKRDVREEQAAAAAAGASPNPVAATGLLPRVTELPDRATIAQAVSQVMAHLGIARPAQASNTGANSVGASADTPGSSPAPKSIAAEVASRVFDAKDARGRTSATEPADKNITVVAFVDELDVRRAVRRSEKIFIGPKTIVTPSARDIAGAEDVIVETRVVPAAPAGAKSSGE
jgi:acetaldehyde dehydrogenase (acetylating)